MSSKIKIPVAAPSGRPFILDEKHYTTIGFNQLLPVYAREVYPGDKFDVNPTVFARAAVPTLPSLADVTLNLHAFYVPFSQVWLPFNDFINGVPHANTSSQFNTLQTVPYAFQSLFVSLFKDNSDYASTVTGSLPFDLSIADITEVNSQPSVAIVKKKLTLKGKIALKVLNMLGYNFNWIHTYSDDPDFVKHNTQFSLLPLLCFFKAYLDYFVPSRYQQSHPLYLIMKGLRDNVTSFTTANLKSLFDNYFLYADNNYFTSAWLNPNAPAPNLNNFGYQIANNINVSSDSAVYNSVFGPTSTNYNETRTNSTVITDTVLKMLTKFSNFVRRNNFVGSRAIERLASRFGITPPEQIMDMCQYLGSVSTRIENIEVTSNANSSVTVNSNTYSSIVGDYSGMQYINGEFNRSFVSDVQRHGYIFVFASLGVPSVFLDGFRRSVRHLTPTSFYTPEFDGGILQAIDSGEYVGRLQFKSSLDLSNLDSAHFLPSYSTGYNERYAETKTAIDNVTGDFTVPTLSSTIDSFVLPRRLINVDEYVRSTVSTDTAMNYVNFKSLTTSNPLSQAIVMTQEDSTQFNRIFRDLTGFADPYYVRFEFKVRANRRMLNSDETAELLGYGHEDKLFDNSGTNLN